MSRALTRLVKRRTVLNFRSESFIVPLKVHFGSYSNLEVRDIYPSIVTQLTDAGVPEPKLSAQYLLSKCLQPSSNTATPVLANDWVRSSTLILSKEQDAKLSQLVQCRLARMPIQYIVGNWDFHNITLLVQPPVFIPRPETEHLVDLVIDNLPGPDDDVRLHLLEIGPGSGAVSLAILAARQDVNITCVERSKAAIDLTLKNARLLGVDKRIKVVHGKVEVESCIENLSNQYDLVFSNPPYVLRKDLMNVDPEISVYEDLRALDGGAEGLDVVLPLLELAGSKLETGGRVILEVDPCHPHILPPKLKSLKSSFIIRSVVKDFRDKERFMVLSKS